MENPNSTSSKWRQLVTKYQQPETRLSIWQLVNTLVPYALLWALMVYSLQISYWLTLLLAIPTGGLMTRIFIFFHDCGHGSFFKSARANHWVGSVLGVLVFTPYFHWRQSHAVHHATAGNLDKRGTGDVWTLTLDEYLAAPRWKQVWYRVYRHPVLMLGVGPLAMFLLTHRFPNKKFRQREVNSVHWTNLALAGYIGLLSWIVGFREFWLVQIPIMWVGATAGVWLFYVQHQFDGVYWERAQNWDFVRAGLEGSSFYKLPKVLQWFTGNIGFHHIHHLSPKIPNYLLEKCHRENKLFQVRPLGLIHSLESLKFRLWDEKNRRLVGFKALKNRI